MGTLARRTEPVVQPNYPDNRRLRIMKRIYLVLAVAAVMAMMVAMAAPAFSQGGTFTCTKEGDASSPLTGVSGARQHDLEADGWTCTKDQDLKVFPPRPIHPTG